MATSAFAANAYRLVQGLSARPGLESGAEAALAPSDGFNKPDFAAMLRDAVQGVVDQGKVSEAKSANYANGKGNIIDVVTAVSETEVAMETMVAMRDKVITAYEDIMKMPM
jgi:flagellar hook-basal body complex protein FliE